MIKILVTGSTGFIGKRLVEFLSLSNNYKIITVERKDTNLLNLENVLCLEKANHVFHLAGETFVPKSWENPSFFIENNVTSTTNILEYCRKNNSSITYISSYIYGIQDKIFINEDVLPSPNNPYSLSKLLSEKICEFYKSNFNLNVTIFRPFNIYGPGQSDLFLISKIIYQVLNNKEINIQNLLPKRDYLYVDDFINLLIKSIKKRNSKNFIFNVGSGISYSVREIIDIIQLVTRKNLPIIESGEKRVNEIYDIIADNSRAITEFDWKPRITIKEGIEKIYNFNLLNEKI